MDLEIMKVDVLDKIMLSLRTSRGLCLTTNKNIDNSIDNSFKKDIVDKIKKVVSKYYINEQYAEFYIDNITGNEYLRLTDPKGFIISNSIISSIFAEIE